MQTWGLAATTVFTVLAMQTVQPVRALDLSKTASGADHERVHYLATGAGVDVGIVEARGLSYDLILDANPPRTPPAVTGWFGIRPQNNLGARLVSQFSFRNRLPGQGPDLANPVVPADGAAHTTLVADVTAGANSTYQGVAPRANIYFGGIDGADSVRAATAYLTQSHVGPAANPAIRIFNNSWGAGPGDAAASERDTRYFDWLATERDIILIKSAGNRGIDGVPPDDNRITAPGNAFNLITVGALNDEFSARVAYSSYWLEGDTAATRDVRGKPEILAPGTTIADGHIRYDDANRRVFVTTAVTDAPHADNFGTSFAAPHVTGTAALVLDYADNPGRSLFGLVRNPANPALAPADSHHAVVKAVILNPAEKDVRDHAGNEASDHDYRAGAAGLTARWTPTEWNRVGARLDVTRPLDDEQGTGALNSLDTLYQYAAGEQNAGTVAAPARVPIRGWDRESVGAAADRKIYEIQQPLRQGDLTVTLTWDRLQEEVNAAGGTIGVVDPGDTYRDPGGVAGNALRNFDLKVYRDGLAPANLVAQSISAGENVEHLHFPVDQPGRYFLEVTAAAGTAQDYALAWWSEADARVQQTGAVSFSVDGGALNPLRPVGTANPAEGIENVFNPLNHPNDVYVLGTAPAIGPAPGGHQLPTEGEIFLAGTGSFDVDPDGTNIDRLSGALGNVPRVGPHQPLPANPPATGDGVLGLQPGDNINALSYGKDSGNVLYFSVDPQSVGAAGTDVHFQSTLSPGPLPLPILPGPLNPGGGDPGDEAAGDIFASQRFAKFGSYYGQHLAFGKKAPLIAAPGDNLLLYDESELGLQAPAVNGSAIGAPEDDLDALEMSDPSDPIWGVDFNADGVLQPWEDPVWFSLDWFSPSIGLMSQPFGGDIPLFTPTLDQTVSADDILMTPPGFGEDINGNGVLDLGEDFNGDGLLDDFTFGIYASGLDMGLLMDDNIDALVLSDEGLFGLLDPGLDEALFSLAAGSPTLAALGFSAADVFQTDFTGNFWLYAGHNALGLLFDDDLNALDIRPAPLPASFYLLLIGLGGLLGANSRRAGGRPMIRA